MPVLFAALQARLNHQRMNTCCLKTSVIRSYPPLWSQEAGPLRAGERGTPATHILTCYGMVTGHHSRAKKGKGLLVEPWSHGEDTSVLELPVYLLGPSLI